MIDKNRTRDTQIDFSTAREFIPQLAPIARPIHSLSRDIAVNIIAACGGILVGTIVSSLGNYLSNISIPIGG